MSSAEQQPLQQPQHPESSQRQDASQQALLPAEMPEQEFQDISLAKDGSVLKRRLRLGRNGPLPVAGDYAQFYLNALEQPQQETKTAKIRLCFLRFGQADNSAELELALRSMQADELAEFVFRDELVDLGEAVTEVEEAPDTKPVDGEPRFRIELVGHITEDITKAKDRGVLRFRLKRGEGASAPNDGANVHCHLVGYRLDGRKFEERDVQLTLGEGAEQAVPRGVELALAHMRLYEKCRVAVKRPYAFKQLPESLAEQLPDDYEELIYELRLNQFESAKEVWELGNDGRLEAAKRHKEKGTGYFTQGKFELAAKFYAKLVYFIGPPGNLDFGELEEEKNRVLLAGYLNLAQTYLNLNRPFDTFKQCDLALQVDADSVKAHFRKGLAHLKCKEYDVAAEKFERVLQLDASNRPAQKELQRCRQLAADLKSKERSTFRNMFEKFALVDEEKRKLLKSDDEMWKDLKADSEFVTPEGELLNLPIKML